MDTNGSTAVITAHCARCSGPVVSDPDAELCRACWAAASVAGERVSVDAEALDRMDYAAYRDDCTPEHVRDAAAALIATAAPLPPAPAVPGHERDRWLDDWATRPMTRDGAAGLLGQFWHAIEKAVIFIPEGCQPTAEEIARSEEAGRTAKAIEQHVIAMLSLPRAPLPPAPAVPVGVAVDAATLRRMLAEHRVDMMNVMATTMDDSEWQPRLYALEAGIQRIIAAFVLASTTPAVPVGVDRAAFGRAVDRVVSASREAAYTTALWEAGAGYSPAKITRLETAADSARAALLALVPFADAPADAQAVEA